MTNAVLIPLRNRHREVIAYGLVDREDAPRVLAHSWHRLDTGYIASRVGGKVVRLHRFILGLGPLDRREGDHINRDRLDNRRSNLRIATRRQNQENLSSHHDGLSAHRGVSWHRRIGKWQARAQIGGVEHRLGYFGDELSAAKAASDFRREHMPYAVEEAS